MLVEGQELWFVPQQRYLGKPRFVTVTKVGRVWAQISEGGYRINKDTLAVDGQGFTSPGKCYASRELYEAETQRQETWSDLRRKIDRTWGAPDYVTAADIAAAAKLLKIDLQNLS